MKNSNVDFEIKPWMIIALVGVVLVASLLVKYMPRHDHSVQMLNDLIH